MMLDGWFQDAIAEQIDTAYGWWTGLWPEWLVWLFALPLIAWGALIVGMAVGYLMGRFGVLAVLSLGIVAGVTVWLSRRK